MFLVSVQARFNISFSERQHYNIFHAFVIIRCLQANLQETSLFLSNQKAVLNIFF